MQTEIIERVAAWLLLLLAFVCSVWPVQRVDRVTNFDDLEGEGRG